MGDHESLTELDRLAPELLTNGRPLRLQHRRDELAGLDFRGHPWARLLAACVLVDSDPLDREGRRHALAARRAFRRRQDAGGEGCACFLLGCWALEHGSIPAAAQWWGKARHLVGTAAPGLEIMLAHRGLEAYAGGRLPAALAAAEEAAA